MIAKDIKIMYGIKDMEITLVLDKSEKIIQEMTDLKKDVTDSNGMLDVKIKQYRAKRSLDANAYCFVICDKIAKAIGNTKEYVYKEMVRQVGPFEIVPIKDEAVSKWIMRWEEKGLGWQSRIMEKSKLEGYTNIVNYFGSSVYDTKEMSILLKEIIHQAEELGINTLTKTEQNNLIEKYKQSRGY